MTEHDRIDDAALEIHEEFNALIQEYDNRDVVVRAVTGILAATAYAASNSPGEARELVNAMAKKPEPPKPTSWTIYKIAAKAERLGTVETTMRVSSAAPSPRCSKP
jgi:ABC-type nitrate/sulfonate/bicarbonate transport system substrate-binding protein